MATKVTIDMEWDIETKAFRCASLTDGKGKVKTYTSLSEFVTAVSKFKKGTIIGGHYVISDLGQLVRWGQGHALPAILTLEDSLIVARLLYGHAPTKDLKTMSAEHGWRYESLQKEQHGTVVTDEDLAYCAKDSWASHHLWHALTAGISKQTDKVLKLNNAFQKAFFAVELAGLKFDIEKAKEEEERLSEILNLCVTQLPEGLSPAVKKDDNILRAWLLDNYSSDELKLFPKTKERHELSVGSDYLKLLDRKPPGFDSLLLARETQSFLSLYVQGKQRFLDEHQFLYPSYKLLIAKTHRRSTVPSIQNWPKEAREFIVSRWPKGNIVWGDFKQLEARLFAWQCGSQQMMSDLIERGYIGIASRVYGLDVKKNSEEYKLVKATVLATQYNMGAGKLRLKIHLDHGIKISYKEAQAKLDKFFNTYPEIATDAKLRIDYAWKHGQTMSDVGAPIPLYLMPESYYPESELGWDGTEKLSWPVKQVNNFAINYRTQQLAGYVTGCALLSMQDALADECGGWNEYLSKVYDSTKQKRSTLKTLPILEVHDELGADSQNVESTKEFMRYHMLTGMKKYLLDVCPQFDCPLDVDLEHKPYWSKS